MLSKEINSIKCYNDIMVYMVKGVIYLNNKAIIDKVVSNVEKTIIGKKYAIYNIIKGILADGHILIEDVPGVGKTTLVKALAKSLNLTYGRIQFTPDLLPSDVTGISIFNQKTMQFEFRKGPVFSNILLADEINRTSPKTQSALLEAMEERQISEGNSTYEISKPFIVLATENPVEHKGTFALPEAQLDRFMIKIKIGYPDALSEAKMLEIYKNDEPLKNIESVTESEEILSLQKKVREVYVSKDINNYIVSIVNATRNSRFITLGASPRASIALLRMAQAEALLDERDYAVPEDVKSNAVSVLCHRIILSASARANSYDSENIIKDIVNNLAVPKIREK